MFKEQEEAERHNALETYWERWYARESSKRKTQRNFARWSRDTRLRWDGVSSRIKEGKHEVININLFVSNTRNSGPATTIN